MRTIFNLIERPLPGARQPEGWTGMKTRLEHWRPVVGYESDYQVSNWGRVKSLARVDSRGNRVPERILKLQKDKYGYLTVCLYKDGKQKLCKVHRLIAQAFIPNPDNLPIVNHKDENKENNFVFIREDGSVDFNKSNLEWCDYKYSADYGTRNERIAKATSERLKGVYNTKLSKPVYQYTLDGTFIREWSSVREVQRQTGWSHAHISQCCNGKRKSAYNYIWRYID